MATPQVMKTATALPSIVAFGSQTTWPSSEYLSQMRNSLLLDPRLRTFITAIKELPHFWQDLLNHNPDLSVVPAQACLDDLVEWLNHGAFKTTKGVPANVLTMPFTIILHICQYFHYLDRLHSRHSEVLEKLKTGGVQGFCTGMLTAIAVASSRNEEEINVMGAVALKLALCVGAYVDLDGTSADVGHATNSIAVRWRSGGGHDRVLDTLKRFPDVGRLATVIVSKTQTYCLAGVHFGHPGLD